MLDDEDHDEYDTPAVPVQQIAPVADLAIPDVNQTAIVSAMHAAERKLPNPILPVRK